MKAAWPLVLFLLGCAAAVPASHGADARAGKAPSRRVALEGPGNGELKTADVVQVLDSTGEPGGYFMDVGSVICAEKRCEVVPVRLHFDAVGNYERYELPPGRNLTKLGHQPFSADDHEKLQRILSDPYSPLRSVAWGEITLPKEAAAGRREFDAMSGATALSKRSMVVTGAAYTCFTLWHWSHGEAMKVIREMTIRACDQKDLLRLLGSDRDSYALFAIDQLLARKVFDADTVEAVTNVLRRGSLRQADSALSYLAKASSATGVDCFLRCGEDEALAAQALKRVRFLEALREHNRSLPAGCRDRLSAWLGRADSYYEIHLLLTLLERDQEQPEQAIRGALALLENQNALVVRRSYRYLKAQSLNGEQKARLEAFERVNPDP